MRYNGPYVCHRANTNTPSPHEGKPRRTNLDHQQDVCVLPSRHMHRVVMSVSPRYRWHNTSKTTQPPTRHLAPTWMDPQCEVHEHIHVSPRSKLSCNTCSLYTGSPKPWPMNLFWPTVFITYTNFPSFLLYLLFPPFFLFFLFSVFPSGVSTGWSPVPPSPQWGFQPVDLWTYVTT